MQTGLEFGGTHLELGGMGWVEAGAEAMEGEAQAMGEGERVGKEQGGEVGEKLGEGGKGTGAQVKEGLSKSRVRRG